MDDNNSRRLSLSDFDFAVPDHLVAQQPTDQRTGSRLLVAGRTGPIHHGKFTDIIDELPPNSLLILNRSRVIPSRVLGTLPTGGKVEIFLLEPAQAKANTWHAMGRPGRKLKPGTLVDIGHGASAIVESQDPLVVEFQGADNVVEWLDKHGYVPLPPYIARNNPEPAEHSPDRERYQTVYAQEQGSVAAPTAGLHFDEQAITDLKQRGVEIAEVCLHVGGGTFLPVKTDDPAQHSMHAESFMIPRETVELIDRAKAEGRPVIAVGTTAFRAVESYYSAAVEQGEPKPDHWLRTRLFVRPDRADSRYQPKVISGMVTNFHQPKSTLFMLISALMGFERAHQVYGEAIANSYRLFSYGDSSLLKWAEF